MAVALTTIFGTEIKVAAQPRDVVRQYTGFPGAHGVTAMFMGSRGRQLVIAGKIATSGGSYSAARAACQAAVNAIEAYLWSAAADYSFMGTTHYAVVFDQLRLIPDGMGKYFHWTVDGYVTADFICIGRSLL